MDRLKSLFSFGGRTSRLGYWRIQLAIAAMIAIIWVATIFVAMEAGHLAVIPLSLLLPVLLVGLAVAVRRLHDRDKGAWWLVPFWLLPSACFAIAQFLTEQTGDGGLAAVGALLAGLAFNVWAFVEIGCRRGTPGPNRFGPVPPSGLRPRRRRP